MTTFLMIRRSDNRLLDLFLDFTRWFTGTKSFVLTSLGKQNGTWAILRSALENFPALTELTLGGEYSYNMELGKVLEILGDMWSSRIRTLKLAGISTSGDSSVLRQLQLQAETASFTTLKIRSFLQTPKVLEDLVRWPASLESFDLKYTFGACYSRTGLSIEWSLNTLQPILAIHRTTLQSISIRCINFGGLTDFDVRDFPNLQELRLSEATTSPRYRNSTADAHLIPNLIAPRLRVFHWDLTLEDQQCSESLGSFAQKEEDFLRAVAHEAIKVKCPLRMLRVTYTPDTWLESDIKYP
ncbi:hypothetical protein BDV12DRAFT_173619 [Aspergillus spectabilis]